MKKKTQMPRYYGVEIARNAQRRFFKRKHEEAVKAAGIVSPLLPKDKKGRKNG